MKKCTPHNHFSNHQIYEVIDDLRNYFHAIKTEYHCLDISLSEETTIVIKSMFYAFYEDNVPILEYAKRYIIHRLVGLDCVDETL